MPIGIFFVGHELEHAQEALEMCQNANLGFDLLEEVGDIAKKWVFAAINLFWSNLFRSLIRAQTGSFANVCTGTSPLYIKVGQIVGLSKNRSWVLVDARRYFFVGHDLQHAQEALEMCQNANLGFDLLEEIGDIAKKWVLAAINFF